MSGAVLVLGATSAMARAIAEEFASRGDALYLGARDADELDRIAADLRVRYGVPVDATRFDADQTAGHADYIARVLGRFPDLSGAVVAFGYMVPQPRASADAAEAQATIARNLCGAASVLEPIASHFEANRRGFIIGISSVAGDRGRQSNYCYGAAKAGFSAYLQGLRNRLHRSGVRVLTVKPGFVDTAMTFGLPGMFLVASPAAVARSIVAAIGRGRDVVYVPWFWRYIMLVIRAIPEPVFKRLKL